MENILNTDNICTTLNADESIAKGCALQAAILSPWCKVKDYKIIDRIGYDIKFNWIKNDKINNILLFKKTDSFPKITKVSIKLKESAEFYISFDNCDIFKRYKIYVNEDYEEDDHNIKILIEYDMNGHINIHSAYYVKKIEEDKNISKDTIQDTNENTNETKSENYENSEIKSTENNKDQSNIMIVNKKIYLDVNDISDVILNEMTISEYINIEKKIYDKHFEIIQKNNILNKIESYCYDTINSLETGLDTFMSRDEHKNTLLYCNNIIEIIYNTECEVEDINNKYNTLKNLVNIFNTRKQEYDKQLYLLKLIDTELIEYESYRTQESNNEINNYCNKVRHELVRLLNNLHKISSSNDNKKIIIELNEYVKNIRKKVENIKVANIPDCKTNNGDTHVIDKYNDDKRKVSNNETNELNL